jgi:cytidine deaminase
MNSYLAHEERERLIQAAQNVAKTAYAPYSQFRVGAAILGEQAIHIGSNVENASYGLSLCAERAALSTAIAQGEQKIRAIAIACIDATESQGIHELLPCGACRQWLVELAYDAEIVIVGTNLVRSFKVNDLMPMLFQLQKFSPDSSDKM